MVREPYGPFARHAETSKKIRNFFKKQKQPSKDAKLVAAVEDGGIIFSQFDQARQYKIDIFRGILEYETLTTGPYKDSFCKIEDCSDSRLTLALKREYNAAKKRLEKIS